MAVDAGFIEFYHFSRGTYDFHTKGCVVASQNPDQQKPKSTRRKPRSTKIITHKHKDMPTITKTKFWNPNPKLNPVFFNNYIETKLKDIQQLHKDKTQIQIFLAPDTKLNLDFLMLFEKPNTKLKTQNSNPKLMNKTQDPKTINNHGFRERESWVFSHGFREIGLSFWPRFRERELGFRP